ncbi:MAG: DNRLRE domain-containing protein [Actinomycetota bacterium]
MGFDRVFANRISLNRLGRVARSTVSESQVAWDEEGVKALVQELQNEVYDLRQLLTEMQSRGLRQDIIAAPDVDASTFYETASDGALRAGVDVVVEGEGLVEVAMLEAPTIAYASADATVDEANPTTPYDTTMKAGLDASGNEYRALLAFAWGTYNPGTEISGLWAASPILALVRLHKNGTEDDALDLKIFPMDKAASWSESTVTWNTKPADEENALDHRANDTAADYSYFDITPYIRRAREMRDGSWSGSPPGLSILATGPDLADGNAVTWDYRGSGTDDYKPQLWYWEKAYKSQILGSATKEAKFYGKPGGEYYITFRYIDANNNPGKWAIPVKVTLPSQGATPSAPAAAPTINATNLSNMKEIVLSTTIPVDFDCYEVQLYDQTSTTTIKTRADRFMHVFSSGSSGLTWQVRYRYVTRSGKTSNWSSWTTGFTINNELKIQRAAAADGVAHILIDADGHTHLKHTSGSSSNTYDYVEGQGWLLCHKLIKDIAYSYIEQKAAQDSDATVTNTTSTSYVSRGGVSLTPAGSSGTARVLVIATLGVAGPIRLRLQAGSTNIAQVDYGDDSSGYSTVTLVGLADVAAGSATSFNVDYKSVTGAQVTVHKHDIVAVQIGMV